jgi:ADP-dependent NAD(P)H-hydrate dehydratase
MPMRSICWRGRRWRCPGSVLTRTREAARLLGISTEAVQADRPGAARKLARKYASVCVLKGAGTLVADPAGRLALCDHGHPAMAGAGWAMCSPGCWRRCWPRAGRLAGGLPGVWLHARAGERLGLRKRPGSHLIAVIRELLEEHSACLA